MPIPHSDSATVADEKLSDYLLNPAHPVGGPKARWFLSRGFDASAPRELRDALLEIVRASDDYSEEMTLYGAKDVGHGDSVCPDGSPPRMVTVWIAETESSAPRLVTAYPEKAAA